MRIPKHLWACYSFVIFIIGITILIGCSKSEKIEGVVKDIFGNPLSDVTVKIEKSTFSDKTDSSGRYSLDYVPGSINVVFSKEGYTTKNLTLDIQQKAYFPAETMVLYPIPPNNTLFYIDMDSKQLVKLDPNSKIEKRVKKNEGFSLTQNYSYFIQDTGNKPTIKAGKSMFVDRIPYLIMLA